MRILLTGGAGFIGSHIAERLLEQGHEVVIVDNLSTGSKDNLSPIFSSDKYLGKFKFYPFSITNKEVLEELFAAEKFDIINHHAAQVDVRKSVLDPVFDAQVNVIGSLNLLILACKYKVRKFIYASTGGALYGEAQYLPVDECHPINPKAPYGVSKYVCEKYLELYNRLYGLPFVALRYGNVYGPRQNPLGENGVNAIFIGKMLRGETPTIFGTGDQLRDYVYIDDVVEANILAMESDFSGSFNIGTGEGISVNRIYQELQTILSFTKPAIYAPARPGEVEKIYLNSEKANSTFGWQPRVSFSEGLARTVEWFRTHPERYLI